MTGIGQRRIGGGLIVTICWFVAALEGYDIQAFGVADDGRQVGRHVQGKADPLLLCLRPHSPHGLREDLAHLHLLPGKRNAL